jgi:hypothetical protein
MVCATRCNTACVDKQQKRVSLGWHLGQHRKLQRAIYFTACSGSGSSLASSGCQQNDTAAQRTQAHDSRQGSGFALGLGHGLVRRRRSFCGQRPLDKLESTEENSENNQGAARNFAELHTNSCEWLSAGYKQTTPLRRECFQIVAARPRRKCMMSITMPIMSRT